jgi:GNAT superfamily N-acetyltransferase
VRGLSTEAGGEVQSEPVEIRALHQGDQAFPWAMLYQAIYVPPGQERPPRKIVNDPMLRRYVERWGRAGDWGFVAHVSGQPVGAARVRQFFASAPGYGYVDDATAELSIAIVPEHRGRGIGTRLLRRSLSAARALEQDLSLSVSRSNPARRLYERPGFPRSRGSDLGDDGATLGERRVVGARHAVPLASSDWMADQAQPWTNRYTRTPCISSGNVKRIPLSPDL